MSPSIKEKKTASSPYPQVDRRSNLSLSEFRKQYLYPAKPVVITDIIESWPARSRWTMDYFKTRYADTQVTVCHLEADRYDPGSTKKMRIGAFIERIQTASFD